MKCEKSKSGITTCKVPCKKGAKGCKKVGKKFRRSFTLHPNKDNTAAKVKRGNALHAKYICKRGTVRTKGGKTYKNVFTSCSLRRGKK